jgi:hypothetical protein
VDGIATARYHAARHRCVRAVLVGPADGGERGPAPAEPGRGVHLYHPAPADHADPVGQVLGLVQVVGGEQHRGALVPQSADEVPELAAHLRVEAGGGLVQEQQLGAADDAEGDVEAAALASGEQAGAAAALVGQADGLDDLVDVPGVPVVAGEVAQHLLDGDQVEVAALLQHHADPLAPVGAGPAGVRAEDGELTAVPVAEAFEDLGDGGLPGPVRAEQGEDLAGVHVEVDAVDGDDVLVALPEPAGPDCGVRCRHAPRLLPGGHPA